MVYKESYDWDMDISLHDLIEYNDDCIINREWHKTKHDNCYTGCCIYLRHPESKGEYDVMIGLNDDGFTYLGEGHFNGPKVSIDTAMAELIMNRNYLKLLSDNKS